MILSKDIFHFLSELKHHNNRDWFNENKHRHIEAKEQIETLIGGLIAKLAEFDPHINHGISPRKCLFRIYRDIRFSKDKTPYKTWYSAGISIDGRKLDGPEYYLHIEPGASYLATGYWRPYRDHLQQIRQEIDYNAKALFSALKEGGFQKKDLSTHGKLKRAPAGYSEEDEHIELLKLKNFILNIKVPDSVFLSKDAESSIAEEYKKMYPFKRFIHHALDQ
ncbi:MAG TPA: DUF2461 domain-containing protein [Sphingobacterium sp.]|nr:DUF2461 domain-containing protein [Sphingobacterium sp.]